jgi:hypothetical protein
VALFVARMAHAAAGPGCCAARASVRGPSASRARPSLAPVLCDPIRSRCNPRLSHPLVVLPTPTPTPKTGSKDVVKSGGEWISSIALENAALGHPKARGARMRGSWLRGAGAEPS